MSQVWDEKIERKRVRFSVLKLIICQYFPKVGKEKIFLHLFALNIKAIKIPTQMFPFNSNEWTDEESFSFVEWKQS